MNEQRVRDLIEALQKFDPNTRISTPVELMWNDTRTAIQASGLNAALSIAHDLKADLSMAIDTVQSLIRELE